MSRKNPKNLQKEKNPIQVRRELLGMTQMILHAKAQLSYHTIQRTEQGLMPHVPRHLYAALYPSDNDPAVAEQQYAVIDAQVEAWKTDTRRKNSRYLRENLEASNEWFNWLEFRTRISESKAGFCKLYCIHPHVLDHFEAPNKVLKRVRLAEHIERPFRDAGLGDSDIDRINEKLSWGVAGKEMSDG